MPYGHFIEVEMAINRMNVRTKFGESYYPQQATIVKRELIASDNAVKRFLGKPLKIGASGQF